MPCAKLRRGEAIVADVIDGTRLTVNLPDGTSLVARLSRRLVLLHTQYAVGDTVQIGMLPNRGGDGLILTKCRQVGSTQTASGSRAE